MNRPDIIDIVFLSVIVILCLIALWIVWMGSNSLVLISEAEDMCNSIGYQSASIEYKLSLLSVELAKVTCFRGMEIYPLDE